jgi:hypothetical protein
LEAHRVERKLSAIFAADVEGYSRLMGLDEVGTLRTLTAYRVIIDRLIASHRGRIFNTAGDERPWFLSRFGSSGRLAGGFIKGESKRHVAHNGRPLGPFGVKQAAQMSRRSSDLIPSFCLLRRWASGPHLRVFRRKPSGGQAKFCERQA